MRDEGLQDVLGHRGIESRRRLVQDQQIGAARQRQQQRELGPASARQRLYPRVEPHVEAPLVPLLEVRAPARVEPGREADQIAGRHRVVEVLVFADESRPPANGDARRGIVDREAEHAALSARRPRHPEQHLDRRRLPGAVPAEEAADRSARHAQVQSAHRLDVLVALVQLDRLDRPGDAVSHGRLPIAISSARPRARRVPLRTAGGSLRR